MQLFIAQQVFACAMYLFHSIIGKRMLRSFSYYMETMDLIDCLFTGKRNYQWKVRAINLMDSYAKQEVRSLLKGKFHV